MPSTPPTPRAAAGERLLQSVQRIRELSRTQRELLVFGAALLVGLLVMPLLIWLVGSRVLGPYIHGENLKAGPWSLFADYVVGLAHGSSVFWAVALGPAGLLLLVRGFLALWRVLPQPPGA
jgi:hypothetical protein